MRARWVLGLFAVVAPGCAAFEADFEIVADAGGEPDATRDAASSDGAWLDQASAVDVGAVDADAGSASDAADGDGRPADGPTETDSYVCSPQRATSGCPSAVCNTDAGISTGCTNGPWSVFLSMPGYASCPIAQAPLPCRCAETFTCACLKAASACSGYVAGDGGPLSWAGCDDSDKTPTVSCR